MTNRRWRNQMWLLPLVFFAISAWVLVAKGAVLTPQTLFSVGLTGAEPLAVSPDSQQVYVGAVDGGDLSVFRRDATGSFTASTTYTSAAISGSAEAQSLLSLAVSGDGKFVYAGYETTDNSAARITVLAVDDKGVLSSVSGTVLTGSTRLTDMAVSPDGAYLYAVDMNNLYVYVRNPNTGILSLRQTLTDNVNNVDGLGGAWAIVVSPDSRYIYVSGEIDNAIAVFGRDTSGQLNLVAVYRDGVDGVSGLVEASGLALSPDPDGAQLYVAAPGDNAVSVFNRDAASGTLQPFKTYQDGMPGFDALTGASALSLSPEGSQLYVLGSGEDALTVMHRNDVDGSLAQVAVLRQGQILPAVDGLSTAFSSVVTPDGKQLLVTSPVDNTLAVFGVSRSDLNLVMQAGTNTPTAGANSQFQLIVTNNGPDSASGVTVTDPLPDGATVVSGNFGQNTCSLDAAQLRCDIGTLSSGQQLSIAMTIKFPSEGTYINSATVAADQRDPRPDDNRDQVTLQVAPSLNKPPVAEPDLATTLPDVAVDIPVLANDHDPDQGDTIALVSVPATSQQDGVLSINHSDSSIHYVPASGFHGVDSFSYTIADSQNASVQGEVTVTVNTPPEARDDNITVTEDTTVIIHVLANDQDVDGDLLKVSDAQTPSKRGGTVGVNDDGTVTYIPPAGFSGDDSFSYTVDDGFGGGATAQVNITVTAAAAQSSGDIPGSVKSSNPQGGGGSVGKIDILVMIMSLLSMYRRRL